MAISKTTAIDIAMAYREIEAGEQLLAEIRAALSRSVMPDIRDAFGRPQGGLQLGIPSGKDSTRLFQVPWSLADPVIEAHIASMKARLAVLQETARIELGSDVRPDDGEAA